MHYQKDSSDGEDFFVDILDKRDPKEKLDMERTISY